MTEERKPCPFCGGNRIQFERWVDLDGRVVRYRLYCVACLCAPDIWKETAAEAIVLWNTRPIEDALRAENNLCENCQNPIAARSSAEIIDWLRMEIERLRETLTEIRDLARTGLAPTALNMTEDQWDRHRLNRIAWEADAALQKQRGEG
jgi:hypothetical protein